MSVFSSLTSVSRFFVRKNFILENIMIFSLLVFNAWLIAHSAISIFSNVVIA